MKAVRQTVDDWPVTHPVIRAALLDEDVCPDCGHDLKDGDCEKCRTHLQAPETIVWM